MLIFFQAKLMESDKWAISLDYPVQSEGALWREYLKLKKAGELGPCQFVEQQRTFLL